MSVINTRASEASHKNIESNDEKKMSSFIGLYFILRTVNTMVSTSGVLSAMTNRGILAFMAIILAINLIIILPIVLKRNALIFILVEFIAVVVYFSSIIINQILITQIISRLFWTVCACIPLGICAISIRDKRQLYHIMLNTSYIMAAILSLLLLIRTSNEDYMMNFSNAMLYPCLFSINEYIAKKKVWHLLLNIYCIMTILLFGSRGAFLCIIVFVTLRLFMYIRRPYVKITFLCSLTIAVAYFDEIFKWGMGLLANIGITSRSILLLKDNITYIGSRDTIWQIAKEMVNERWLTGWGVVGELNKLDIYPHSIYLEIMIGFGVLLGGVILAALCVLVIRMLRIKEPYLMTLCLVFFSISTRLFISGTYLTSEAFFLFIFLAACRDKQISLTNESLKIDNEIQLV